MLGSAKKREDFGRGGRGKLQVRVLIFTFSVGGNGGVRASPGAPPPPNVITVPIQYI